MPNHFDAIKRMRQTKRRSAINRSNKGVFRASLRRIRQHIAGGAMDQAKPLVGPTLSRIDKAVQKGLIHKNAAARLKSRLMKRMNATPSPAK